MNGTIYYWLTCENNISSVIAFDVGKGVFRSIKRPDYLSKLFAVGGQLVTLLLLRYISVGGENPIGFSLLEENDKNEVLAKENIEFPANLGKTEGLRMSGFSPTGEIVLVDDLRS